MLGAIAGDIIGSPHEAKNPDDKDFDFFTPKSRFTDDTVLTVATADTILNNGDYLKNYQKYFHLYPHRGWGGTFKKMASAGDLKPYDSYGNGSAMRISPVGWAYDTAEEVMAEAKRSAEVTHSHPEGIRGAQGIAMAIFCARQEMSKYDIKKAVEVIVGYDLSQPLHKLPKEFDVSCQGTIPICMAIFDESESYEEAIRMAVLQGGDVDTNACIVGGIAEAYYKEPPPMEIQEGIFERLPTEMTDIVVKFVRKYIYPDYEKPDVEPMKEVLVQDAVGLLFDF
jgi:ADP-ribosylglycohydrolase